MQTLPDAMASVSSDGKVHWRRTGGITAFCQFTGLSQIPFDVLGCQLLIGPRARKDTSLIRYNLFNGTGLVYATAPAAYNEYLPVPELAESGKTYGDAVLYLNLFFRRSKNYYVNNLIVRYPLLFSCKILLRPVIPNVLFSCSIGPFIHRFPQLF